MTGMHFCMSLERRLYNVYDATIRSFSDLVVIKAICKNFPALIAYILFKRDCCAVNWLKSQRSKLIIGLLAEFLFLKTNWYKLRLKTGTFLVENALFDKIYGNRRAVFTRRSTKVTKPQIAKSTLSQPCRKYGPISALSTSTFPSAVTQLF